MKVTVTGSLGNISKPLTKALVEKGHMVTVISSKPEKEREIKALGAAAALGSLEDPDFLVAAFAGADAVYTMVPPNFTVADMRAYYRKIGNNYAQAIVQSGVKRVVNLSSWGAHLDKGTGPILGSHDVEGILDKLSDAAVTHLRPTSFYTNFLSFVGMIKGMGFIGSNYGGDDRITMVHPTDIAAVVVEELTTPAGGRKVRYVASDEHTADEAAHILGAAIGKPDLKWVTFTDDQSRQRLQQRGMPAHIAEGIVQLGASIHSGLLREDYDLHKPAIMGSVKLTDFAKEFAAVFASKTN